jgi:hypothetical protein
LNYSKRYWKSPEGRKIRLSGQRNYLGSNSDKAIKYKERKALKQRLSGEVAAKAAIRKAIKDGIIFRKSICAACFKESMKTDFHHTKGYAPENYLDVVELCRTCHAEAHNELDHQFHPRVGLDLSLPLPVML